MAMGRCGDSGGEGGADASVRASSMSVTRSTGSMPAAGDARKACRLGVAARSGWVDGSTRCKRRCRAPDSTYTLGGWGGEGGREVGVERGGGGGGGGGATSGGGETAGSGRYDGGCSDKEDAEAEARPDEAGCESSLQGPFRSPQTIIGQSWRGERATKKDLYVISICRAQTGSTNAARAPPSSSQGGA